MPEPMSHIQSIFCPKFLAEIHHLLWTKKFNNRGRRDEGWSCRDHSAIVALLLQLLGIPSNVCFGKLMMITGPIGTDRPYGLDVNPHRWNFVEETGHIDLSVRVPKNQFPTWDNWEIDAVVGSKVQSEPATKFLLATSERSYHDHIAPATHLRDNRVLIYKLEKSVPVRSIPMDNLVGWIESPLGCRLQGEFQSGPLIYMQALYHLWMFIQGERETLTIVCKNEAWEHNLSPLP